MLAAVQSTIKINEPVPIRDVPFEGELCYPFTPSRALIKACFEVPKAIVRHPVYETALRPVVKMRAWTVVLAAAY